MSELWLGEVAKMKRLLHLTNKDIAVGTGYTPAYIRYVLSGLNKSDVAKARICEFLKIEI